MVSNKPFSRLKRFLTRRGFTYRLRFHKIYEYTRYDITILLYESPDLTHYKYIFLDTATKWIIEVVYTEKIDKYGYLFKKHLRRIEQKRL